MEQKTQTQVTQLVFNINTLDWQMYFHIRGCNTIVKITSVEATSLLKSIKQDDSDRVQIQTSKDLIYYIIL